MENKHEENTILISPIKEKQGSPAVLFTAGLIYKARTLLPA